MNFINFLLVLVNSLLLVTTQIGLKLWIGKQNFSQLKFDILSLKRILSFDFFLAGISFLIAGIIWMYLLKKIEFSLLYPFISLSYIFGALAAMYFFHESIPFTRWIGMIVIIGGVYLVSIK